VAVELDVGDVFDDAVRREDAVLVIAAEERDLDLLALVLVRVILDSSETSVKALSSMVAQVVDVVKCVPGVTRVRHRIRLQACKRDRASRLTH